MSNQQSTNVVKSAGESIPKSEQGTPSTVGEQTEPILLYDANCDLCKGLALQIRSFAKKPIRLVALSDPEATQILSEFYSTGWTHDFYLVNDGACRKGIRAFPQLARLVGIKQFASLVGDYARYKRHSANCGQDSADTPERENPEPNADVSRRSFTSMMGAGAFSLAVPLSRLTSNDEGLFTNQPPKDLSVHVAKVTPQQRGGFDVSIQRRPDLILSDNPTEQVTEGDRKSANTSIQGQDISTLTQGSLDSGASYEVRKAINDVTFKNPNADARAMMRSQNGSNSSVELTMYDVTSDSQRFTTSIHAGRGPVRSNDGDITEMTTMSGTIAHDLPQSIVDFVWIDADDLSLSAHLDAYALGVKELCQFYGDRQNTDLATLYKGVVADLLELRKNIDSKFDEKQPVPVSNQLAISGLSSFQQFTKPPEDAQPVVQGGLQCKWGCAIDILCCGIGPGCGVCVGAGIGCSAGGCCVIGGSCGYYCCYNW